jgi:pimeloyl-ACP methyl ester carboxylesterase
MFMTEERIHRTVSDDGTTIRSRGLSGSHPDLSPERLGEDVTAFVDSIGEPDNAHHVPVLLRRGTGDPRPDWEEGQTMTEVFVDSRGSGPPVVLAHGSLATGDDEWERQQPLAEEGFRLLVVDRRGYGQSPAATGEDFLRDAEDLADVMGDGAHLVGHSYGGLGLMLAAARRPDATRSLALLEPPAFTLGCDHPAGQELVNRVQRIWDRDLGDKEWLVGFLEAVGSDPDELPPELLDAALPLVSVARKGRPAWDADLPLAELAAARYPKLVVSGGHQDGFEAICDDLAERIGASRLVVEGAGHEIQFTGKPINEALRSLWATAP